LISGTVVKRASLHNADQIEKLALRIGDAVFVEKGGEIIPKITGVDAFSRGILEDEVKFITHCPECHSELERHNGEAQHFCPNQSGCPPQQIGKIQHFIGRKAMDIEGLGGETVSLLYHEGVISNLSDLYRLKRGQLLPLERMAEKSVNNLLEGIDKSKEKPFPKVLFGLGIRYVGETVAKKLAQFFGSIDALQKATFEELMVVEDIGERIAQSIVSYFENEGNRKLIEELKSFGLQFENVQEIQQNHSAFEGKRFVVSGVFENYSREQIKEEIESLGGIIVGSVSSKTDFLVAGEGMGPSKKAKAEALQISILTEQAYKALKESGQ